VPAPVWSRRWNGYEVRDEYDAEAHYETRTEASATSEQDGEVVTWSISRLPLG
jgi:hypothetical protein